MHPSLFKHCAKLYVMFPRFMILCHDAFVPLLLIHKAADTAADEGRVRPGGFHGEVALRMGEILLEELGDTYVVIHLFDHLPEGPRDLQRTLRIHNICSAF